MNAPSPFISSIIVAAGGACGSVLRFQAGRLVTFFLGVARVTSFPWATLAINVSGSLAMGLLAGWLARYGSGGEAWRLLLGVGLLGGFTTFSSFSLELGMLMERGQMTAAMFYAAASLAGGIVALFVGLTVMRTVG